MGEIPGLLGAFFFIVWGAMMIGMVVGYVLLIIALWRGMKAHESIASSLKDFLHLSKQKDQL